MRLNPGQKCLLGFSLLVATALFGLFFHARSPFPLDALKPNPVYTRRAMFWERADLGVKCGLCPFNCYIPEGGRGKCRVRMNRNGTLYTQNFGQLVSLAVDPIEKKPVFHLLPGTPILSLSTVGCPLRCSFCQNWSISQAYPEAAKDAILMQPADVVREAENRNIPSIAFTYGEPAIFYEFMYETAKLAKEKGIRNVIVTSGYINAEPMRKLAPYIDVIKVDLKGISSEFYADEVGGYLEAVLRTLKLLRDLGVLVEVVNLVVPERNDSDEDFDRLSKWIRKNMGADCPLFFSRFHPDYKLRSLPRTPAETLERARRIAMKNGLNFVYIGNLPGHEAENTYCPNDGTVLVARQGYMIKGIRLRNGACPACGRKIPGVWR